MNKIKSLLVSSMACALLTLSASLWAHTGLSEAVPADGAVIDTSPQSLSLRFTADVRLLKLSLLNGSGDEVEIAFTPSAVESAQFSVELPDLAEDSYTVEWAVLGSDSHRVEGTVNFKLSSTVSEASEPGQASHQAGHQH